MPCVGSSTVPLCRRTSTRSRRRRCPEPRGLHPTQSAPIQAESAFADRLVVLHPTSTAAVTAALALALDPLRIHARPALVSVTTPAVPPHLNNTPLHSLH